MNHAILEMPQRMDAASLNETRNMVTSAFEKDIQILVLDFQNCAFVDSRGLSVIVTGIKLSTGNNVKLRLINVNEEVRLLLQITRFDRICDIHQSLDSALKL